MSHLDSLEEHIDTDFVIADDVIQEYVGSEQYNNTNNDNIVDHGDCGKADYNAEVFPKIVAAGRMKALQLAPIVDKVIELAGVELPNVLYIGTASFDRTDKFNLCTEKFHRLGCEIKRLDVSEDYTVPPHEVMREVVIDWPDVIMCSGGNTLHALLRWKDVGLDLLIKEASMKGTVLCGGSAGAGCWFSSLHTDSLRPDNTKHRQRVLDELDDDELADWDYARISGLGFVDAMCVPHFDATGTNGVSRAEDAKKMLSEDPSTPAIGIDENAALLVVGDAVGAVSGDGTATCHLVLPQIAPQKKKTGRGHRRTRSSPIPTNLYAPLPKGEMRQRPLAAQRPVPAIVSKVVELSGVDQPNILYVGTASFDDTDKFLRLTQAFRDIRHLRCEIKRLDVSKYYTVPPSDVMRKIVVDWADVIMCSGGDTSHALMRWKDVGLDLLMKEASAKGTVLCGGSAGGGCWFSGSHSDSLGPVNPENNEDMLNELDDETMSDWDYARNSGLGGFINSAPEFNNMTGTNGPELTEPDIRPQHSFPISSTSAPEIDLKDAPTPAICVDSNVASKAVSEMYPGPCEVVEEIPTAPMPTSDVTVPISDLLEQI